MYLYCSKCGREMVCRGIEEVSHRGYIVVHWECEPCNVGVSVQIYVDEEVRR